MAVDLINDLLKQTYEKRDRRGIDRSGSFLSTSSR
jgi:hypothetical protein